MSVEVISAGDRPLCYIVRQQHAPEATTFVTPDDAIPQVGFIVHPAGHVVKRHQHLPLERHIRGTPEVLVVRQGRCEMEVYDDDQRLVATHELIEGDVMVMVGGGHGFRMLEDTVLLEIKQGPYYGTGEKEYF